MSNYIQIGKIINTHGIRGEVKVVPLTDDMSRYDQLTSVIIEGEDKEFQIERVRYSKGFVVLKFEELDNINDVLRYKDKLVLIDKKNAVKLSEDSYFIYEIIGLEVYHNDGTYLGKIEKVLQPGSNDVYVVKGNGKELLIPALKQVVRKINLEEGIMIIEPLEGMIE